MVDGEPPAPAHIATSLIAKLAVHLDTKEGSLDLGGLVVGLIEGNLTNIKDVGSDTHAVSLEGKANVLTHVASNPDLSWGAIVRTCEEAERSQTLLDFHAMISYARLACYVDRV